MTSADVAGLTAQLDVEHGVIYAYGVVGGVLGTLGDTARDLQAAAASAYDAHRARRDRLQFALRSRGVTPPAAQPAYAVPLPSRDRAGALALAVRLEENAAASEHDALATLADPDLRADAAAALTDAARRASTWRLAAGAVGAAATPALPGV